MTEGLTGLVVSGLVSIALCVVLPIFVVWLVMRRKTNETNKRAELIKLALENNPQANAKELIAQLGSTPSKAKNLKERLLARLMFGAVFAAFGLGLMIFSVYFDYTGKMTDGDLQMFYLASCISLIVGIAVIVVFLISKRMLKNELEAEAREAVVQED